MRSGPTGWDFVVHVCQRAAAGHPHGKGAPIVTTRRLTLRYCRRETEKQAQAPRYLAGSQEQNPSNSISSNVLDAGVCGEFDGSGPKRGLLGLLGSKTKIHGSLNMFSAQSIVTTPF